LRHFLKFVRGRLAAEAGDAARAATEMEIAKYDEALKDAPNWKLLKEARDTLAKQKAVQLVPSV
jgi:hypothetical protein